MEQKKIKFLLLTSVITFVGCVLSGCTEEVFEEITSNRITFSIDDQGFNESKVYTRGAKVSSVTSFGVSASVYGASSTYTSAGCGSYFFDKSATAGTPTSFYWPTSDYKLSFFGYYPKNNAAFTLQSTANATGAPTYAYTVPSAIANQVDVMTGQNVNILGGGSSPVNLSMKHRCAAICFNVTNSRSSAVTLNSISIEGVKYSGTLNEDSWTLTSAVNSSASNPFTLSYGSSIAANATVNVTGTTNIFLMLPQPIPAGAKVKVVIDGEDPLYANLTGSWVAGRQYNYSLEVKNNAIVVVDEESEVEDWRTLSNNILKKSQLKVLDIGNSYTIGATSLLPLVAEASGADLSSICVYQCERGGASFKNWVDIYNDNDSKAYSFTKVVGGLSSNVRTDLGKAGDGKLFRDVLTNETWDIIIIHQVSTYAPYYSSWNTNSAAGYLDEFISLIKENQPSVKLGFLLVHSYWSGYSGNTEHSSYDRWQLIANSARSFCEDYGVDFVIPYGTAILAEYTAACCYYESLIAPRCGISVLGNSARIDVSDKESKYPSVNVTDENALIAQTAAYLATQDMYRCQNPEDYTY